MPVNTVNVGSQVSGTIESIYVDYNSTVKKGDILLKIEPSVLQASVDEASIFGFRKIPNAICEKRI